MGGTKIKIPQADWTSPKIIGGSRNRLSPLSRAFILDCDVKLSELLAGRKRLIKTWQNMTIFLPWKTLWKTTPQYTHTHHTTHTHLILDHMLGFPWPTHAEIKQKICVGPMGFFSYTLDFFFTHWTLDEEV